jgi:hypothetical protein
VFGKFKEFKALIENLSERKIKILKSDNGGECTSKDFVRFCRDLLASEVTPGLLAGAEPNAHQFYVTIVFNG